MKILRDYQRNTIDRLHENTMNNKISVVGLCPNAGKTFISLKFIEEYLAKAPHNKILMLCEGQDVLRKQNYEVMSNDMSNNIKFCRLEANNTLVHIVDGVEVTSDISEIDNFNVVVTLPQTIDNKDLIFELIIVDEAHNRYFSDQIQRILANSVNCNQVLMTGTPSKFIYENELALANDKEEPFDLIVIPMVDIYKEGLDVGEKWFANSSYYISSTNLSVEDMSELYNDEDNLKSDVELSVEDNNLLFDDALRELVVGQVRRLNEDTGLICTSTRSINALSKLIKIHKITELTENKLFKQAKESLGKTMWVCYSQNLARLVCDKLNEMNIKSLISISDETGSVDNIALFQEDESIKCLVVVNRAVLGFNMPELANVIDLTGTRNLNRIYQLFSRITRVHDKVIYKRFFKVGFKDEVEITKATMNCSLSLMGENIRIYTGKNGKRLEYTDRVKKNKSSSSEGGSSAGVKKEKKVNKGDCLELHGLDILDVFTDCKFKLSNTYDIVSKSDLVTVYERYGMWGGGNSEKNKRDIIAFYHKYGKRPNKRSKDKIESRLGSFESSYTTSSKCYDKGFHEKIEDLRKKYSIFTQSEIASSNKDKIISFYHTYKRNPSICSKDSEEANLARLLGNYLTGNSFDNNFKDTIVNIKNLYGIKHPKDIVKGNKDNIIAFYNNHKRNPKHNAKDSNETKLKIYEASYTGSNRDTYDKEFHEKIKELRKKYGVKTQEDIDTYNKKCIIEFYHINKRNPSICSKDSRERQLSQLEYHHIKRNLEFRKEVLTLRTKYSVATKGRASVKLNKQRIKDFINQHARIPSGSKEEERKLYGLLYSYIRPKSNAYDELFTKEISELWNTLGIKTLKHSVLENRSDILQFVENNLRTPKYNSKDKIETRLGRLLNNYRKDEEFMKQVEQALAEANKTNIEGSTTIESEQIDNIDED